MTFPGETLLTEIWKTLSEKGIGKLLKPWQDRREGMVKIELSKLQVISNAEAQIDAEKLRKGITTLKSITTNDLILNEAGCRVESDVILDIVESSITNELVINGVRKEVNLANVIQYAEENLKNEQIASPTKKIDDDWLYRWRDYASEFSNEKLQEIWGKALAGEFKSPGSYSLRCLEFLKNLSQEEATNIEKIAEYVIDNKLIPNVFDLDYFKNEILPLELLLDLQSIGFLVGLGTPGINFSWESGRFESYEVHIQYHGKSLVLRHSDKDKTIYMSGFSLTPIAVQVLKLVKTKPNIDYIKYIGNQFKAQDVNVTLADIFYFKDNEIRSKNEMEI